MPTIPNTPNMPGGGWRQQRAAQLRSEAEAEKRIQRAPAEGQAALGDDRMHCVQEGETIESIADLHNCSPESIRNHPSNAQLSAQDDDACTLTPGDNVYIPTEDEQPPTPVGQGEHIVKPGECTSSIAKDTGHFWETIWKDPANSELREVREDPNVLLPGDRVTIPALRRKEEPRETEERHRFVRRGEPAMLRLQFFELDEDAVEVGDQSRRDTTDRTDRDQNEGVDDKPGREKPRGNTPFVVDIDGEKIEGVTDANGCLECPIPGNAKRAVVHLGEEEDDDEYEFALGGVDPIKELTGVQHRLNNLDFRCGRPDGQLGRRTDRALRKFQKRHELAITGKADDLTRKKLLELHGS